MQLHRWKKFGHRYLGRMVWTSLLLILLPCLIALFVMMQQAYSGILDHTRTNYATGVRDFSTEFVRRLDSYRSMAMRVAVDSRDSDSTLYILQQERADENAYYYMEMRDALASFNVSYGCKVHVYFSEIDALVSSSGKYTAETFHNWLCSTYAVQDKEAFLAFLQSEQIDGGIDVFSTAQDNGMTLVSVAARVGLSKKPAKILFLVQNGELNTISLLSQLGKAAQLAVYDADGQMIYVSGTPQPQWAAVPDALAAEQTSFSFGEVSYELFQRVDELDFRYVLVIPYQQLTYSLGQFYRVLQTVILLSGGVLLLAVLSTVSINYAPVFRTVTKYGVEHERDEFESIAKSFDLITAENSDKEMLIMDLLYRNMLYGVPIPPEQAVRLQRTGARAFCVMTMAPLRMTSAECGRLTGVLFEQLQIQTYMTDLLPEERTVVICFMNHASAVDRLAEVTAEWLRATFPETEIGVYVGPAVESINEIYQSFRACDEQEKAQPTETIVQEIDTLAQDILDYIKANYADLNLSRTMVADHFRISVYSLSRVFKNQLNIGFSEYLINCRLEHVVELLLTTEQTLAEITEECGFGSASYLAKLFRSVYSATPMQYRKTERAKRGLPDPAPT